MPEPAHLRQGVNDVAEVMGAPEVVRVLVLGPLAVEHDGRPLHVAGTHRRRLLAFLASRVGQVAGVDAIVDALWGDDPPPTATRTIQSHIARLRGSLAGVDRELIETTAGGYRLAIDPDAVDATEFEQLAAQGRRRLGAGDFAGAASVLDRALASWRGEAYVDFARTAEFASSEQVRLNVVRWAAVEDLTEARLECGALESVIADLERLVAEQPGRERAWGLLMRALYAAGRQHDALVAFQRARRALVEGFGLTPGPDLRAIEHRILEHDATLMVRGESAVPAGLRRDSTVLVGREGELAWLVDGWRAARAGSGQLRLVLGPADSGRTRLAAELAATAAIDGGHVLHVRGKDGFDRPPDVTVDAETPGGVADRITERSRAQPVLVVVDDAEWADAMTVETIVTLAGSIANAAVMAVVIAEPSASGPALQTLLRLDRSEGRTLHLETMPDQALAQVVGADGVERDGVAAVLAVAGGLPGVARREAAAWVERAASDRLTTAAVSSIDATAAAVGARASMFDDVLALVAARTRRDELTSTTWEGRQPYRALAAYQPQDADLFVGRERLVAELAARVLDRRLVAVIGASGSGKSSVVRAGLVPLARSGLLPGSGPWRTTLTIPRSDPDSILDALDGLDEPGPQLLVIDQFEEVFAAGNGEAWARRILDLVLDNALDVHAVIVIRADQYGALATIPSLAALVEDAQVMVAAPTDDELRRIVAVPARRTGCHVEPALVDMIADDVAGRDASLPLVSAVLAEVWRHRVGTALTADAYVRLGGLSAAVERMGAAAVRRAGEDGVRDVMLRLVDVTEDGQWVRRRVPVDDMPDELADALDALVDARVVQRDDRQIDVVHEVVFHAWPQLASWLEEARGELVQLRELRAAARAWDAGGRNDDDLYRGARLVAGDEFVGGHQEVGPLIAEFIAAGSRVAERAVEERERQRARVTRRLRALLAAAVTLLVLALAAGTLALQQAHRADNKAEAAEAASTRADARRASTQALVTPEIDLALLLAMEGARLDESPETRGNLLTLLSTRQPVLPMAHVPVEWEWIDVSPDGEVIASAEDGRMVLRDAATLDVVASSPEPTEFGPPSLLAFSPDSALLATAEGRHLVLRDTDTLDVVRSAKIATAVETPDLIVFEPGGDRLAVGFGDSSEPVRLYDTATLQPTVTLGGGFPNADSVLAIEFSDDGRLLVVFDGPNQILVWDTSAPGEPVLRPDEEADGWAVSPDWSHLYVASQPPGDTTMYDLATGRRVAVGRGTGTSIRLSPDGRLLATGANGPVRLLDADTLDEVGSLPLPAADTTALRPTFAGDGSRLVALGTETGRLYRWDLTTDDEPQVIGSVASADESVVLVNPVDDTVYTAEPNLLTAWDMRGGRGIVERSTVRADPDIDAELALALPAGRVAYMAGFVLGSAPGGSMQILDVVSGRLGVVVDLDHDGLTRVDWTADGTRLATTGADGVVRAWDTRTGALLAERRLADDIIAGVVYINGDTQLLVSELSGDVYVVDAETLEPTGPGVQSGEELRLPFARPAEPSGVVMTASGRVLLINLAAGRVVEDLDPGFTGWWAASSPDGDRLAVVGTAGEVRLYDVAERRWTGPAVQAHRGEQTFVDFSPDGTTFLTTGFDGRLGLWDGATGEPVASFVPGEEDVPIRATYVGDSQTVFAAAADGTTYTWDIDPAHWIDFACATAGRNLTADEWQQTFGDRSYRETCPQQ
jgi:DNA-binding SARP family transcriptional activator/WD40 repeat protein